MSKLKWWVAAFVLWQVATLFYKDKWFKDKISEAKWTDKLKLVFDELVELNKKMFNDIKDYDYSAKVEDFKSFFETEKQNIENKIKELSEKFNDLNETQVKPFIQDIEARVQALTQIVSEKVSDVNEKYKLEEKISLLKDKINEIKNKVSEK